MNNLSNELASIELADWERAAHALPVTQEKRMLQLAIIEIRNLQTELMDPNYLYSGTRIHRNALLCRDAEIDSLRKENKGVEQPK